jgi:hypothetical protein
MKLKLDYVLIVTILLGLRAVYEVSLAQAIVALGFLATYGYLQLIGLRKQPDINKEIKQQLEEMQNKMSSLYVKSAAKPLSSEGKRFF